MIEVSSTSSFCSNPDALGIDESEKGIFYSLKSIACLPPSPLKGDDQEADSAAGTAGDRVLGEAGKESPAAGTGECLDVVDSFFHLAFADCLCMFQISGLRTRRRVLRLLPELILSRWRHRSRR